jgi:hypothetical protein
MGNKCSLHKNLCSKIFTNITDKLRKWKNTKFDQKRIRLPEPLECSICLDNDIIFEDELGLLSCKHHFHKQCIAEW